MAAASSVAGSKPPPAPAAAPPPPRTSSSPMYSPSPVQRAHDGGVGAREGLEARPPQRAHPRGALLQPLAPAGDRDDGEAVRRGAGRGEPPDEEKRDAPGAAARRASAVARLMIAAPMGCPFPSALAIVMISGRAPSLAAPPVAPEPPEAAPAPRPRSPGPRGAHGCEGACEVAARQQHAAASAEDGLADKRRGGGPRGGEGGQLRAQSVHIGRARLGPRKVPRGRVGREGDGDPLGAAQRGRRARPVAGPL